MVRLDKGQGDFKPWSCVFLRFTVISSFLVVTIALRYHSPFLAQRNSSWRKEKPRLLIAASTSGHLSLCWRALKSTGNSYVTVAKEWRHGKSRGLPLRKQNLVSLVDQLGLHKDLTQLRSHKTTDKTLWGCACIFSSDFVWQSQEQQQKWKSLVG